MTIEPSTPSCPASHEDTRATSSQSEQAAGARLLQSSAAMAFTSPEARASHARS